VTIKMRRPPGPTKKFVSFVLPDNELEDYRRESVEVAMPPPPQTKGSVSFKLPDSRLEGRRRWVRPEVAAQNARIARRPPLRADRGELLTAFRDLDLGSRF